MQRQLDIPREEQLLRANPRDFIEQARTSYDKLDVLAKLWWYPDLANRLISLGVLDLFFSHLSPSNVPIQRRNGFRNHATDMAIATMFALANAGNILRDGNPSVSAIKAGWPGIWKWTQFFWDTRIENKNNPAQMRRIAIETACAPWFGLTLDKSVCQMILQEDGALELLTKIWLLEEEVYLPSTQPVLAFNTATAALGNILKYQAPDSVSRVVNAVGGEGKITFIAELALSRLRNTIKNEPVGLSTINSLDLIDFLSRDKVHLIRHSFLNSKTSKSIPLYTKFLLDNSKELEKHPESEALRCAMISGFGYIFNHIESTDGFTWVIQAVQSGLLKAYLLCTPYLDRVSPEDSNLILDVLRAKLPPYLVYKSVILACSSALKALDTPVLKTQFRRGPKRAVKVWDDFVKLVDDHMTVVTLGKAMQAKNSMCNNVQCHKMDAKSSFRKCGACGDTLYCSPECQKIDWQEGDHRVVCKLKQKEYINGKYHDVSRSDLAFLHFLPLISTKQHRANLRQQAQTLHPSTPLSDFVITIDYLSNPPSGPTFSVVPLEEYTAPQVDVEHFSEAAERNQMLFNRFRENTTKMSLIQSAIKSGGGAPVLVTTTTAGCILGSEGNIDINSIEW